MLDYLMDFHAVCAISLFSMQNLVFLLVEKKCGGINESFLIRGKNRFLKFVFSFSDWISYPLIVLLPLAYPCKQKTQLFSNFKFFMCSCKSSRVHEGQNQAFT